jgi:hypothetical protein
LERILRQMRAVSAHALGLTSGKAPL